jgi:hypothetical protein
MDEQKDTFYKMSSINSKVLLKLRAIAKGYVGFKIALFDICEECCENDRIWNDLVSAN